MKIENEEITFIVQGPVGTETKKCVNSIRENYPGSEIILSTWIGSDIDLIKRMTMKNIVYSTDPGDSGRMFLNNKIFNNINRQLVSTKAGLSKVNTKYAVKTRTDFRFINSNLKDFLNKYEDFCINEEMRFVDKRILTLGADRRFPFFIFDFCFAGKSSDLRLLFNIPLMDRADAQYFPEHEPDNMSIYNIFQSHFRWIPEQFIILSSLKENGISAASEYFHGDWSKLNEEIMLKSLRNSISNFCVLGFDNFGVRPTKDSLQWLINKRNENHINFQEWLFHYKNLTGVRNK